jgi:hypothetical protein
MGELWRWNGHRTRSGSRAPEHDSRGEATDTPAVNGDAQGALSGSSGVSIELVLFTIRGS